MLLILRKLPKGQIIGEIEMTRRLMQTRRLMRGFSLVEFAIVLGVAGIVLGGIWGVAGMIRNNVRQQKFSETLYSIIGNIRGNYMGKSSVDSTLVTTEMPLLVGMNVFSGDTVHVSSGVSVVDSPFGEFVNPISAASPYNSLYVCGWTAKTSTGCDFAVGTANVPLFAIEVLIPAGADCINAVLKNSSATTLPGLVGVYINNVQQALPIGLTMALASCVPKNAGVSTASVVDFVFRLTP